MCPETVEISVPVPVYDCEDCLSALNARLTAALKALVDSWEIVLLDDRNRDASWEKAVALPATDEHVKAIPLSRNFGQHPAITAGLSESAGRWTVVMGCDLQDPPEAIPDLYAQALEGHEIVFARRRVRRQSLPRRAANRFYFALRRAFAGVALETEHSNLSMIAPKARRAFLAIAVAALAACAFVTWQTPRFVHEGTGRELVLVLLVAAACAAVAAVATVSPARRPAPVPADSPPLRR